MNDDISDSPIRAAHMLLVEDNRGDVMLIKRAFAQSSTAHQITVAPTAEDALKLLQETPAKELMDIIILDLNLPGMSGHQLLAHLKSVNELKHIPVIILSSSRAERDIMESYNSYANCYIAKPHDLESLCRITGHIEQFWFSIAELPENVSRSFAA